MAKFVVVLSGDVKVKTISQQRDEERLAKFGRGMLHATKIHPLQVVVKT